jgi:hypothetical protein
MKNEAGKIGLAKANPLPVLDGQWSLAEWASVEVGENER